LASLTEDYISAPSLHTLVAEAAILTPSTLPLSHTAHGQVHGLRYTSPPLCCLGAPLVHMCLLLFGDSHLEAPPLARASSLPASAALGGVLSCNRPHLSFVCLFRPSVVLVRARPLLVCAAGGRLSPHRPLCFLAPAL